MRITKFGHSCLFVEEDSARILIDPGIWSEGFEDLGDLDAILLSHEHQDHTEPPHLKQLLERNPQCRIYTNAAVGKKLAEAGLTSTLLEEGMEADIKGVLIKGFGKEHALIYPTLPVVPNTGFLIANRLFYPGDSVWNIPAAPVEILALPVVAPWMKIADAVDFAKAVKPRICFPVHDGMLKHTGPFYKLPEMFLAPDGIQFVAPEHGVPLEL